MKSMLNHGQYFCQIPYFYKRFILLLVLGLLLSSCTSRKDYEFRPVEAIPVWNKVPKRFSFRDKEGDFIPHLFFDLAPFISLKQNEVNFVALTSAGDEFSYGLDTLSGKLYRKYHYCEQQDVWDKFRGTLETPPYTTGAIPRVLDQLGNPQQIKVYGRKSYYRDLPTGRPVSHRARVVGGVILHYCPEHPCSGRSGWLGKLVLVGIDPLDPQLGDVTNLEQLKQKVDWKLFKAFIQNENGRFIMGDRDLPGYRLIGEVGPDKALNKGLQLGHVFKFKEMKELRQSCHKLYDYLWQQSLKTRESMRQKKGDTEFVSYLKKLQDTRVIEEEEEVVTKKEVETVNFKTYFKTFQKKYLDSFSVCSKYVRPASINHNLKRHWFMSYLTVFARMNELGYFYSCRQKAWVENPRRQDNTYSYDPIEDMWPCSMRDLDRMFPQAITHLEGLKQKRQEHYRYVDYDSVSGGTHEKLHGLINFSGKGMKCLNSREQKVRSEVYADQEIMPEDAEWNDFSKEVKDDPTLIR